MRLQGYVGTVQVLMLIDSGRSSSSIISHLLDKVQGVQALHPLVKVKVTDGGILWCTQAISACTWVC